jgi:hypothetical protein
MEEKIQKETGTHERIEIKELDPKSVEKIKIDDVENSNIEKLDDVTDKDVDENVEVEKEVEDYVDEKKNVEDKDDEKIVAQEKKKTDVKDHKKDDIKIEKVKAHEEIADESEEDLKIAKSKDTRNIFIAIAIILGIFAITLGSFKLIPDTDSASGTVKSIEELHADNLNGLLSDDRGYMYNNFSFVKYKGLWTTILKIGERRLAIQLHHSPRDLEDIEVVGNLSAEFNQGESVYVAIDPLVEANKYYTLSIMELSINVARVVDREPLGACTTENEACIDREIINCDDTKGNAAIELKVSDTPRLTYDGACVLIEGSEEDIIRVSDRFLYEWFQVMG